MEIDKLIEQLTERAHLAAMNEDTTNATMLVIKNEINVSGKSALVVGRGRVGNKLQENY